MKYLTITISLSLLTLFSDSTAKEPETRLHSNCGQSPQAQKLAQIIIHSNQQQRKEILCNKKLAEIAEIKAKSMANANKIQHRIDFTTPNQLLRKYGINLPENYPLFDNQVESIMGAVKTAKESFDVFLTSPDHKQHLLGEKDFLLKQNQIGVGFYQDDASKYVYHWVVYITEIIPKE